MPDTPERPLELVSTSDMLDELKSRFDSLAFIGYRNSTHTKADYVCALKADLHEIYGFAAMLKSFAEDTPDAD